MSEASSVVFSCGVRLSQVELSEIRKPQVGGPQKPTAGGNTLTNYHKDRASSLNQREQRSCSMLRWRYAPAVGVNTITVFSESFLNCNWQSRTLPGARLSVCQGEAHTKKYLNGQGRKNQEYPGTHHGHGTDRGCS